MLGQTSIIENVKNTKARSVLITGPAHWGKKTLLREVFKSEEAVYEITGNAQAFRETLDRIYLTARPTIYIIPDVDKCNITIQNLLLKMLEEPPLSSRFFLTASGSVLPTIASRCVTFRMEPYGEHILDNLQSAACLFGIFKSPGQLNLLNTANIQEICTKLVEIKNGLVELPLSKILLLTKEVEILMSGDGLTQDAFIILANEIYGKCDAVTWLRQQPVDNVKYVRKAFYMKLWVERQVLR